jgi:hypothetical protein
MEQEEYLVEGEFILSSYNPPKLLAGMSFITKLSSCLPEPELYFFTIEAPPKDEDDFIKSNGCPIVLNIISTGDNGEIIALQEEIGMFDDGSGTLKPITEEQINIIINQYGGIMNIESDETGDPILYDGKVIISYLSEPENEEEL